MYGITDDSNYSSIANAIRSKNGSSATYLPSEMPAAISAIQTKVNESPISYDLSTGYVNNGVWTLGGSTVSYSDVYEIRSGRKYLLSLGSTVGTRFRAMQSTVSPVGATSNITGTAVINQNNPAAYASTTFTASADGYLTVTKDNAGQADLESYLIDMQDMIDNNT
jgi:hypothetical protein